MAALDKKLPPDTVALNKLHRTFLQVSRGQQVDVDVPVESSFDDRNNILVCDLEVSLLTSVTLELAAEEIEKLFRQVARSLPVAKHCPYLCDFKGTPLVLVPTSVQVSAKTDAGDAALAEADYGVLFAKTETNSSTARTQPKDAFLRVKQPLGRRREIFSSALSFEELGIGGLNKELSAIIRRAFVSRTFSATMIEKLGLTHVKGLLLYGPPGTGKTLIARQIGAMLKCSSLKVVNGPEVLNKYVGQSEENVRALFTEAEEDHRTNGADAGLHIVIFDEIDAICKQRGTAGGGTGVNDSVVNQLLSKIDGIEALPNVLVIGMTNRKDLIDAALLRPGRFEVHVEIGLPDEEGRKAIFRIHCKRLLENNMLGSDVDFSVLARATKNYSGAEIQGVVKCAISFASYETTNLGSRLLSSSDTSSVAVSVSMSHFEDALKEVLPAFGTETGKVGAVLNRGFVFYSDTFRKKFDNAALLLAKVAASKESTLLSVLVEGSAGSGSSSFAAKLALQSGFDFCKVVSPADLVGASEYAVCNKLVSVFEDAYKSALSLVILDQIERLLGYVGLGPRFLNNVLQVMMVLVRKHPPALEGKPPRRLVVVGTTALPGVLLQLGLKPLFAATILLTELSEESEFSRVLAATCKFRENADSELVLQSLSGVTVGIKPLLTLLELSRDEEGFINYEEFVQNRLEMSV